MKIISNEYDENMKLSEIAKLENCQEISPLYGDYCLEGCTYGGYSTEPPCMVFPNENADDYLESLFQHEEHKTKKRHKTVKEKLAVKKENNNEDNK